MQRSIRILIANHPKLMREAVLDVFTGQADIEIVGEASDDAEIQNRINQTEPHVVVITLGDSDERPAICDAVLRAHPEVHIIAISSRKNRGICYWATLQIRSKNIEPSKEGVLLAIRGAEA